MINQLKLRYVLFLFLCGCFASYVNADDAQRESNAALPNALALPETDDGIAGEGPIRRYDWFKNLWIKRREGFKARSKQEEHSVVFLGDSITQGWGDTFQGDFGELAVSNRGISGDTTRGMLLRLQQDVLDLDPTAIVMLMGTNDLEEAAEPDTIAGNVRLILDAIHRHQEDLPVVLCNVFPSHESKKRSAAQIQEINRQVAKAVKGDSRITILDTWTLFANEKGNAKKEEFPDLLHPNRAGYLKWKSALIPIFATLGLLEATSEPFEMEAGFVSLYNGQNLDGWCFRPTTEKMLRGRERWLSRDPENAPAWPIVKQMIALDGHTQSDDGRYRAIGNRLVVTTPPEGRKIQQLWTTQEFTGDFTLKLEFRATPNADSGVFLMGPQLQCRDYLLAGPYKDLKKYEPGNWNELIVVARGGKARCTCNGEVIEEAFDVPENGPIGLEGDRGQIEYRHIRIKSDH